MINIRDVRTVAVESWLRQLSRKNGNPMANSTKAKIRSIMSVLFNHAIRYEWLEQGNNPISLVRQTAIRQKTPEVLDPHEIRNLLSELSSPYSLMVLLDATTGLRRSELFGLKWGDIDFSNWKVNVGRAIYNQVVGNCKTEASWKPVPLDPYVADALSSWKEQTPYSMPDDWVFASPRSKGKVPYWPAILMSLSRRVATPRNNETDVLRRYNKESRSIRNG